MMGSFKSQSTRGRLDRAGQPPNNQTAKFLDHASAKPFIQAAPTTTQCSSLFQAEYAENNLFVLFKTLCAYKIKLYFSVYVNETKGNDIVSEIRIGL